MRLWRRGSLTFLNLLAIREIEFFEEERLLNTGGRGVPGESANLKDLLRALLVHRMLR